MALPTRAQIRKEVRKRLRPALTGGLAQTYRQARSDDLFEALILVTIVRSAAARSWTIEWRDTHGNVTRQLWLRRSPGRLGAGTSPFTHACLSHPFSPPMELHGGVLVRGRSGVAHEADVAALPSFVAQRARVGGGDPAARWLSLVVEAKWLSAQTTPLGHGRAIAGLAAELRTWDQPSLGTCRVTLAASSESQQVEALARAHGAEHVGGLADLSGRLQLQRLDRWAHRAARDLSPPGD